METLLTHRAWVRRLARSLARDEASASDLEQRAWTAALRRPPQEEATSRAWLGRVVRNLARDAIRADGRRTHHERAAARAEALSPTADVVAEADAHRLLVLAVHGLGEPGRTTVLLRWFEGLPPRSVAERMGVPVETVRTRLRRAHGTLRQRLQRMDRGDGTWMAALAPLMGHRLEAPGDWITMAAAKQAATVGGALMGTKTVLGGAACVGLAFAFFGGTIVGRSEAEAQLAASAGRGQALRERLEELEGEAGKRVEPGHPRAPRVVVEAAAGQVETLRARIRELEGALQSSGQDVAEARRDATTVPEPDVAQPSRLRAEELTRLRGLTDTELRMAIREMARMPMLGFPSGQRMDGRRILEACALLLDRSPDRLDRYQGLFMKAIAHATLGETEAELAAFRQAAVVFGPGTDEAHAAETQLAYSIGNHGDLQNSAEAFLRLTRDLRKPTRQRAWSHVRAAWQYEAGRDVDRASQEYRAIFEEYERAEGIDEAAAVAAARAALARLAKPASDR